MDVGAHSGDCVMLMEYAGRERGLLAARTVETSSQIVAFEAGADASKDFSQLLQMRRERSGENALTEPGRLPRTRAGTIQFRRAFVAGVPGKKNCRFSEAHGGGFGFDNVMMRGVCEEGSSSSTSEEDHSDEDAAGGQQAAGAVSEKTSSSDATEEREGPPPASITLDAHFNFTESARLGEKDSPQEPPLDFVKFHCQGCEHSAVQGAKNLFQYGKTCLAHFTSFLPALDPQPNGEPVGTVTG